MSASSVARLSESLLAEIDRVADFIESLPDDAWEAPTRCEPLTFRELLAHMLRGAFRVNQMIDGGVLDEQPHADAITYWRVVGAVPNASQPAGDSVVQSARQSASDRTPEDLIKAWRADWETALARARALRPEDPVLRNPYVTIRLSEFLRTRFVEVVVHHMDLRHAVKQAPDPDPAALAVVTEVLTGLLGTDPLRLGMDAVRFALAGTGRETLNDTERAMLGPLARAIPLIV
jgi:uncharacterized protein (TIGR03083 family)